MKIEININKRELRDLMFSCMSMQMFGIDDSPRWKKLYAKLKAMLDEVERSKQKQEKK